MTTDALQTIVFEGLLLLLICLAVPMLAMFLTGLVVGLFGAATQVHDHAFTFVPKLAVLVVTLLITSPWIWSQLKEFSRVLWTHFPQ